MKYFKMNKSVAAITNNFHVTIVNRNATDTQRVVHKAVSINDDIVLFLATKAKPITKDQFNRQVIHATNMTAKEAIAWTMYLVDVENFTLNSKLDEKDINSTKN